VAGHVKAVKVHNLVPHSREVLVELLLRIRASVDLSNSAELGVRTDDEVGAGALPLLLLGLAIDAVETLLILALRVPEGVDVEEVDEPVVGELAGGLGEEAEVGAVPFGVLCAETGEEDDRLWDSEGEQVGAVNEELLALDAGCGAAVVAEGIAEWAEVLEGLGVGLLVGRIGTAGCEADLDTSCLLDGSGTRTIKSATEALPDFCCTFSMALRTSLSSDGLLISQSFCGARRMRAPLAPPRLSVPR